MIKRQLVAWLFAIIVVMPTIGVATTIQHYTIDSSTSVVFNPLAIPRFQIAPLSAKDHVAFYISGFPRKEAFRVTFNLDSTVRWLAAI